MESLMIPSAIQRIRSFLIEMSGMKVKPWATTEETLAALHATLVARQQCSIFWTSLRGLLENLANDLKARVAASPGTVIDNELLDGASYAALLDEIRAALASHAAQTSTFRRLAASLSAPALGLLLLLGGAVSVGCDHPPLPATAPDAAIQDAAAATTPADAKPDNAPVKITLPDARPIIVPTYPDANAPVAVDGGTVTIEDIMDACSSSESDKTQVLTCLSAMRESWTTGLAEALAGLPCDTVRQDLSCFAWGSCLRKPSGDFDEQTAFFCPPPVLIYMGVRFV